MKHSSTETRAVSAGATLKPRGSSQGGLRQYNERVVPQALRLHGPLPAAELARLTHLTAQTISLIGKRLLDDGLILKGELLRGKVGQPSVPLALNPDGAYAIGIKVGRRSLDVLLVDFTGRTRERRSLDYDYPDPDTLFDAIDERIKALVKGLGRTAAARIEGVGIAAPLSLGGWQALLCVPAATAAKWETIDIGPRIASRCKLPVQVVKDFLPTVRHVHMKDYDGGPHYEGYCPLGQGKVDVKALCDLLEGSGNDLMIMAELDPSKGMPLAPLDAARINRDTLQKLGYTFGVRP